ncbi:MAG: ABC transporter substrate-binding protein [Thermomicrobiales bacterium]|nr:ABC transporter substrate-binding protein [Thermomicrobiales bacterium]
MNREPSFVVNELLGRVNRGELSRRTFVKAAGILGLSAGMSQMLLDGRAQAMQDSGATGELVIALPRSLISLDPHGAQSVEEATAIVNAHLLDTLTYRDVETGEIQPRIATAWEQVDDLTWTFTIREGITFHDGSPVTANDVKASLDRVLELAGPLAPLWATVESTEATDDATLTIKTTSPTGTVPTSATLLFVAPAAASTDEAFYEAPIGAGPYKFVSWTRDSEMVIEAVADHWDGAPGISRLIFRDIPEVAARVTSLETGEIDITWALPADQLPTLRENDELNIASTSTYAYYFIWFNASREPFTDVRVRKALWHALDIETMAADLLQDVGVPATAPIPSTVFGHAPQTPYAYDPDLAKSLLAEAGYPDGIDTHIIWVADSGPQDRELLEVALAYWAAVGVRVENREQERAVWLENLLALNWDLDMQTNTVRTGDADFTLRRLYTSAANRTGYANPELDQILLDALASADQAERAELYAQACQIIWDDAVGIFPFDLTENYVHSTRLQDFQAAPNVIPIFTKTTVAE